MNARLFQEFRAMQLAVKGSKGTISINWHSLIIEGIDMIEIGDNAVISEICLDKDYVCVSIFDSHSYMPITMLSDDIIEEVVDTLRAKAVEIANCDIMVNLNGEWDRNQIRH